MSATDLSLLMNYNNLFTEKSIVFEDRPLDINVNVPIADAKFGILKLNAITALLSRENIEMLFMIDCSGSMSDPCSDGRTKMQHICHTLNNMILYFRDNSSINAFITIHAFDDKIYKIVDRSRITSENVEEILTKIKNIRPRDSTNIELALQDITTTVESIRAEYGNHEFVSIFMTDGEVSAGKNEVGYLSELVNKSITNYFIGFGVEHDAVLLNAMGNSTNSSYHFIDKIEHSGYVYGEILHGIVYKLLFNVQIEVTNGFIYDYKNNMWISTLNIGNIVSESSKIYHIISNNSGLCHVLVKAEQKVYDESGNEVIISHGYSVFNEGVTENLDKYIYRQRTMQLLYKVNNYNKRHNRTKRFLGIFGRNRNVPDDDDSNDSLKDELNKFLIQMKKFMTENGLEDDKLMKNLCDDIYISLRTIGTQHGVMYSCARQTSQGTQRCYTVSHTPEDNNDNNNDNNDLRQFPLIRQTNKLYSSTEDLLKEHMTTDITHHQVSAFEDSPFLSPSAAQVMRDISTIRPNDDEDSMEETN